MIKFKWGSRPALPSIPAVGWIAAFKAVPASSITPFTGGWTADAHFSASGSNDLSSTSSGSGVANTTLEYNQATFYLDGAIHLPGIYEIQVMRGMSFATASFVVATYSYIGQVQDFFGYGTVGGINTIARSRKGIQERCFLMRISSVWNEHPVAKPGLALFAVKAKNRSIDQFSVLASGYVKDWDGTGWNTWTTTSLPAPHYVDIIAGGLNPDPLPADLLDSEGLVEWRDRCVVNGYTCDAIFENSTVDEALGIVSSCGYARPYRSDLYGVVQDYDRSAESPVQIFTPRNSSGFSVDIAFPRLPDGFRVKYPEQANNYETNEIIVFRDGLSTGSRLEAITYEGIVDEAKATDRALFDLRQGEYRGRFYSLKTDMQAIICRRGDMVGVQHDILDRHSASARILAVVRNSLGLVTEIVLDSEVDVTSEPDVYSASDIFSVSDFHALGISTGVIVQGRYGAPLNARTTSNATGATDTLTFAAPFYDDDVMSGRIATIGPIGTENMKRLIIASIDAGNDYTAELVLVDEAPELWS